MEHFRLPAWSPPRRLPGRSPRDMGAAGTCRPPLGVAPVGKLIIKGRFWSICGSQRGPPTGTSQVSPRGAPGALRKLGGPLEPLLWADWSLVTVFWNIGGSQRGPPPRIPRRLPGRSPSDVPSESQGCPGPLQACQTSPDSQPSEIRTQRHALHFTWPSGASNSRAPVRPGVRRTQPERRPSQGQ